MEPLHKVTQEELPLLLEWLGKYLPDTYKIYGLLYEELKGTWHGTTYYTLGWPKILAVGEGPIDKSKSKCADFFNHTRHTCVFAPKAEHAEELLLRPDFLDWTKPIIFHGVPYETANVVEKVSRATGTPYGIRYVSNVMAAYPGDIESRPVPDEFEMRSLPLDHAGDIADTWIFRRKHTHEYITEVLRSFPSIGLYDRSV